jgi:hypothetical protein
VAQRGQQNSAKPKGTKARSRQPAHDGANRANLEKVPQAKLTVSRTATLLDKLFKGLIDMSDYADKPAHEREIAFRSRALAALCIKELSGADEKVAGAAVTDGYEDGGVDALYFDQATDALLFVESKWSEEGNKPINGKSKSTADFVDSICLLLAEKFDRFNDKIKKKEAELLAALHADRNIRIILVAAHTALQPMGHAKLKIEDLIERLNSDGIPIASAEYFDLVRVYQCVTKGSEPSPIELTVTLRDWGVVDSPHLAYMGKVHVLEVAQWWKKHDRALSYRNLRYPLQSSEVNEALRKTLTTAPENFWYFNNGITIVCNSIDRSLANAGDRRVGVFRCSDVSIVNGAQTVGMIGATFRNANPADSAVETSGMQGWVQVRIIRCPAGFDRQITQATNFQNAVGRRDFAATDPVQHRLATEFALDGRKYVFKSGDTDPQGEAGCSITEATQALACAQSDVGLAVLVKRNIGELWRDIQDKPYTDLFDEALTGVTVWRLVQVMRTVETELRTLRQAEVIRADLIGVHLHRIILHLVFQDPQVKPLNHDDWEPDKLLEAVRGATKRIFPRVAEYLEQNHKTEYLATLAKNTEKCRKLADWFKPAVIRTPKDPEQIHLFDKPS